MKFFKSLKKLKKMQSNTLGKTAKVNDLTLKPLVQPEKVNKFQ